MLTRWVTLWGLLLLTPSLSRADWPQFRYDAAHTGCTDERVLPPLELEWKYADVSNLDPADKLPADFEKFMWLLDRAEGCVDHTGFGPFPVLVAAGDGVFLNRYVSGQTCLDAETGEVRWRDPQWHWLQGVSGNALVLTTPRPPAPLGSEWPLEVAACDAATGRPLWALDYQELPGLAFAQTYPWHQGCDVKDGLVCVSVREKCEGMNAAGDGLVPCLYMLDAQDGSVIGTHSCLLPGLPRRRGGYDPYLRLTVAAWGDEVILLRHFRQRGPGLAGPEAPPPWAIHPDGELVLMPPDGTEGIYEHAAQWALAEELGLAVGFEEANRGQHVLVCRNAHTRERIWAVPLRSAHSESHPPTVAGSGVYLGLDDGVVYCLDPATGSVKWRCQIGRPEPDPNRKTFTSPFAPICTLARETLWVVHKGKLLALDAARGDIEWETDQTEACWYEPVVSNGRIYLLTCRGVEAWGPATGGGSKAAEAVKQTAPESGDATDDQSGAAARQ